MAGEVARKAYERINTGPMTDTDVAELAGLFMAEANVNRETVASFLGELDRDDRDELADQIKDVNAELDAAEDEEDDVEDLDEDDDDFLEGDDEDDDEDDEG